MAASVAAGSVVAMRSSDKRRPGLIANCTGAHLCAASLDGSLTAALERKFRQLVRPASSPGKLSRSNTLRRAIADLAQVRIVMMIGIP